MNTFSNLKSAAYLGILIGGFSMPSQANLIINGGFEAGFNNWTRADQLGSDGGFFQQSGTNSPANGFSVLAPVEGSFAAMTDAGAGGSHVLYQDFLVPTGVGTTHLAFSLYLNNGADKYYNPGHLDWAGTGIPGSTNLNQQARVDILSTAGDPFSTTVLQNLFQTNTDDPLVSGYAPFLIDITTLLQAHQGETLRLRFAETDNVGPFNFGVDNVSISQVPLPAALWLALSGFSGLFWLGRRRKASV
ncbi:MULTISPECIES: VPLPA-CTERM sorting domain-containing protein [Methylomonas]|uniref:PEP-CTERM protein-sorting domain-containing protein n=2 Tax=Methylomonas TaxID=416 RepID=A0A126T752_9GAMM|nr:MULTISPECIES: PEP-CTERM domain protein [Methylomonas]AMK77902.1 hypothetical protein JT25_015690 [Methylomonas denitrificans]OAI04561.1 hypothetical protein A1342_13885 [Methylomonas methanica]TCV87074.1 putative secreted protein [Methylomonas methanica]